MDNQPKPGYKTTEFWLNILTQVPTVLGLFLGASNPITLGVGALGALVSVVYTMNRTSLKSAAINAATQAVTAATLALKAAPVPAAAPAPQS